MATNLTDETIASTYTQLLHVDGGPAATEKPVLSGNGVSTALKVGTLSASISNIKIAGNAITAINEGGAVEITNAQITGGTISGASITEVPSYEATSFSTDNEQAGVTLSGNSLVADGTDANIDIVITPKGSGTVDITNANILSGAVPFTSVVGREYAHVYSTQDQTVLVNTPTAITFNNADPLNTDGIALVSSSGIKFSAAGVYDVYYNVQLFNSDSQPHEATFWSRKNGVDIPNSATRIVVPTLSGGGTSFFSFNTLIGMTAEDTLEVVWASSNVNVSLSYEAAVTTPFDRPSIPSVVLTAVRVG